LFSSLQNSEGGGDGDSGNECLEIFKQIITLLTVTVLFLFTFFNLVLDAPRRSLLVATLYVNANKIKLTYYLWLVGFWHRYAPVRCAHPSFYAHYRNGELPAPPPPAKLCIFASR
jgi:hypothetical protein